MSVPKVIAGRGRLPRAFVCRKNNLDDTRGVVVDQFAFSVSYFSNFVLPFRGSHFEFSQSVLVYRLHDEI